MDFFLDINLINTFAEYINLHEFYNIKFVNNKIYNNLNSIDENVYYNYFKNELKYLPEWIINNFDCKIIYKSNNYKIFDINCIEKIFSNNLFFFIKGIDNLNKHFISFKFNKEKYVNDLLFEFTINIITIKQKIYSLNFIIIHNIYDRNNNKINSIYYTNIDKTDIEILKNIFYKKFYYYKLEKNILEYYYS